MGRGRSVLPGVRGLCVLLLLGAACTWLVAWASVFVWHLRSIRPLSEHHVALLHDDGLVSVHEYRTLLHWGVEVSIPGDVRSHRGSWFASSKQLTGSGERVLAELFEHHKEGEGFIRRTAVGFPFMSLWSDEAYGGWMRVRGGWVVPEVVGQQGYHALPYRPMWPGFAADTVFYALALWLPVAGGRAARTALRRRRGLCPACAYDLRGSPGGCPECGCGRAGNAARAGAKAG